MWSCIRNRPSFSPSIHIRLADRLPNRPQGYTEAKATMWPRMSVRPDIVVVSSGNQLATVLLHCNIILGQVLLISPDDN